MPWSLVRTRVDTPPIAIAAVATVGTAPYAAGPIAAAHNANARAPMSNADLPRSISLTPPGYVTRQSKPKRVQGCARAFTDLSASRNVTATTMTCERAIDRGPWGGSEGA